MLFDDEENVVEPHVPLASLLEDDRIDLNPLPLPLPPQIKWKIDDKDKYKECGCLFVGLFGAGHVFLNALFSEGIKNVIFEIFPSSQTNSSLVNSGPIVNRRVGFAFTSSEYPTYLFLALGFPIEENESNIFAQELFKTVNPKRIIVADGLPSAAFLTSTTLTSIPNEPALFYLHTSAVARTNYPVLSSFYLLKSPPVIIGLPASLIAYSEARSLPCLYFSSVLTDSLLSSAGLCALLPTLLPDFALPVPAAPLAAGIPAAQLYAPAPAQLELFKQTVRVCKYGKGNALYS